MKDIGEIARDYRDSRCRLCGINHGLHRHHIVHRRTKRCDDPENLVALCADCHRAVHDRRVDLLPHLTPYEQAKAVLLTGSIESARMLLAPSLYPSKALA